MAKLTHAILYLCCFISLAICSTTRRAKFRIANYSSSTLSAVRVRHEYGNIFKQRISENMTWTNVAPGTVTDASMIVEYLTGDPDADRWQVGWTVLGEPMIGESNLGNIKYRQTNPHNFQNWVSQVSQSQLTSGIIDGFRSFPYGFDFIKQGLKMGLGPVKNVLEAACRISQVVIDVLGPMYEQSGGLVGYKQCTLLKGDADRIVNIRIYDANSKLQISPADSSNCDTVRKLRIIPWSPNN